MRRLFVLIYLLPITVLVACGTTSPSGQKCDAESTLGVVNQILDSRGCTASTCHGADAAEAAAGLDLRPESFYDNVVNVPASTGALPLVFPADEERSVLYLKVAAKTLGTDLADFGISGSPMPSSPDVLTEDELQVLRAWIRGGAAQDGFVRDAPDILGCGDAAEASPNKIPPLPAPDADKGIQFRSGGWTLSAESEDEVCYVTYHDHTDRVPAWAKLPCPEEYGGPSRECFSYASMLLAQDPQSHHSIIESYVPPPESPEQWDPKYGAWKNWQCVSGANGGMACDPTIDGMCGEGSQCATAPTTSIACIGYENGPRALGTALGFFGQASTRLNIVLAQEGSAVEEYPEGVFGVMPVVGFTLWNSHAFNLTKEDTTVDQYLNLTYLAAEERKHQREDLTILNDIFAMGIVPPFTSVEACATFTLPVGSRLLTLSSHTHQFGRDFRIWYPPNSSCEEGGPDCAPPERESDYRSFIYQDPLYQRFDEKNNIELLDSTDPDDRTFHYCAIWDNGEADPQAVRKNSDRPDAGSCQFGEVNDFVGRCGCEPADLACLGGPNQGMACNGDDSVCGAGGVCDACPVWGGVTTEEEMFGIIGAFYVLD
jgi:hypothetical protein